MSDTLLDVAESTLLVVDVQSRLHPAIHDADRVLEHCLWLVRLAKRLDVPVLASEQYPEGLGRTVPALAAELPPEGLRSKIHFSCFADGCFTGLPAWSRRQMVVCGTEAHVCVMQTALDLRHAGHQVFVVAEAVGSRDPESRRLALERMRSHGIEIVNREMVGFEWLRRAGDARFREVLRDFLR